MELLCNGKNEAKELRALSGSVLLGYPHGNMEDPTVSLRSNSSFEKLIVYLDKMSVWK